MQRIRLQVKTGELVAEVEMLPYVVPPEIVQWGARFFTLSQLTAQSSSPAFQAERILVYVEGACFPLLDLQGRQIWAVPLE